MSAVTAGPAAPPVPWRTVVAMAARATLGSRSSWVATALTALGVGVGVAVLLLAASVPAALSARDARGAARDDASYGAAVLAPGRGTLLVGDASTSVAGPGVRIRVVHPDGPDAPVPPGLTALPADGEMALSPALRSLLATPEGAVLRARLPYRDVATVGAVGLLDPGELVAYAGDDRLADDRLAQGVGGPVRRVASFGSPYQREPLDPVLSLVLALGVAVLVLPVGVFVATAARFGAERRDRRLAALRLVGLDARTTRALAAAEGLWTSVVGLAVGAVLLLLGRSQLGHVSVAGLGVFPADAVPSPLLALLVVVAVPAVAVAATALGLRGVSSEPLATTRGVQRVHRRFLWRAGLVVLGLLALGWQARQLLDPTAQLQRPAVVGGALLVLLGVLALIPWLVDVVVARLGRGPLPWLLAVRRLQSGGATSGRAAAATAVAVTGVLALQALFAALGSGYTSDTGEDPGRADTVVRAEGVGGDGVRRAAGELAATPDVDRVRVLAASTWTPAGAGVEGMTTVLVGDCGVLAEVAELSGCTDGDVFLVGDLAVAGATGALEGSQGRWSVPSTAVAVSARPDPAGSSWDQAVLATPGALDPARLDGADLVAYLDAPSREALASVASTAAQISPVASVQRLEAVRTDRTFLQVRRALTAAAVLLLAGVGATLLVSTVEQLRERAPVLCAVSALGFRRRTVALSLLLDAAVPVTVGLVLALVAGSALGSLLAVVLGAAPVLVPASVLAGTAVSAAVVLLAVTALSLPALGRAMRPVAARVE